MPTYTRRIRKIILIIKIIIIIILVTFSLTFGLPAVVVVDLPVAAVTCVVESSTSRSSAWLSASPSTTVGVTQLHWHTFVDLALVMIILFISSTGIDLHKILW